ncbi:hypothetical protein IOK49_04975 [Fervidicoccus fontis]|uniref:Polymerase nucleotidyl transferase domain-containing protein n=1 Tax=Fervidicoccus fontis TaxID=683846 RepID=A0A843ABL9_9CREN|nr:hypothetical protein [Fervidicoccus fontis]MBE9391424.1 hypothetical protein [Fervidicoccus fontis]
MIEGFIVEYKNTYWIIRSYYDFGDYLFAIPRYVFDMNRTIKEVKEAIEFVSTYYPEKLQECKCFGRKVPFLKKSEVGRVLDPRSVALEVSNPLHKKAMKLLSELREHTNSVDIGITGGILVGKRTSDIDVIVYGRKTCEEVYKFLMESKTLEKYGRNEVLNLLENRREKYYNELIVKREMEKILQGKFEGVDVYIRLVPYTPECSQKCTRSIEKLGTITTNVTITDSSLSYLYPCSYRAFDNKSRKEITITSDRGRFCEILKPGDFAFVRGELERVNDEGKTFLQLYLWDNEHFLLPIEKQ